MKWAVRQRVGSQASDELEREIENLWRYGRRPDDFEIRPVWAVCSIGRGRWYWALWASWKAYLGFTDEATTIPVATGETDEKAGAVAAPRAAAGPQGLPIHGGAAQAARRRAAAIARAARTSDQTAPAPLEFVYQAHPARDFDGSVSTPHVEQHQIVKRTKTRVYVHKRAYQARASEALIRETFILDRGALERGEAARRGDQGWWDEPYYYATEMAAWASMTEVRAVSPCFVALGLTNDCTLAEVRRAYRRLALIQHPDKGGDAVTFRELHAHYEQACRMKAQRTDEAAD